jgi:hypothetical protein
MKKAFVYLLFFVANFAIAQTSVLDYYNAKVKAIKQTDMNGGGFKLTLTKQDIKNGFLAYNYSPALGYMIGVLESPEEMAYFVSKNGKKFVATSVLSKENFTGSISWSGELPKFYELQKGLLTEKTEQYFPKESSAKILEELSKEGKSIYTKLPQTGTTIQIGMIDKKIGISSFQAFYQLIFDVNSGSFKVEKI